LVRIFVVTREIRFTHKSVERRESLVWHACSTSFGQLVLKHDLNVETTLVW
jgi:hypothetical protein